MSPAKLRYGFAQVHNAKLWYSDTGGNGPALVLCHPASQGIAIWQPLQAALAALEYRVIAYCRRGYERSERGPADDPGCSVDDLCGLADSLALEKFHLLGAAAGGITALGFAVTHEHRLLSLALVGTIFAPREAQWRELYQRLGIGALRKVVPLEVLELGPSYRASDPNGVETFCRLSREAVPRPPLQQTLGAEVTWRALEALRLPVALITGEADLYAPPPLQALIAEHIPNARTETIRACGHAAYWETPDALEHLLTSFLSAISAR